MEEIITCLKGLRPEQIDEVAKIIHRLSQAESEVASRHPALPARMVDKAVENGWPAVLFTELIGSLPEFERAAQPPSKIGPICDLSS